jgi:hypothetical protein
MPRHAPYNANSWKRAQNLQILSALHDDTYICAYISFAKMASFARINLDLASPLSSPFDEI